CAERVRKTGKVLHVLQKGYAKWERCCMFRRKGTQSGKDVACFAERVRKARKMLHVLQEGYARWERCCTFCRKGMQDGKDVA
ncbi:hypothetical protein, partial [Bacillus cereus]|uniref:hypothetical protein n=1 Tax=Bacillus cereus TaxID=1396 RepID=UPI000995120D